MDRLRSADLRRLLAFIQGCYAARNPAAHADYVVHDVARLISASIASYAEADLLTKRLARWVVRPAAGGDPRNQGLAERYLRDNPVVPYYLRTGDPQAVRISDFLTRRQFHCLALYNELYRDLRVEYQLSAPALVSPRRLARITLNRDGRDFAERDRLLLDLIRPHIVQASRNAEALELMRQAAESPGRALLAVTAELRAVEITPRVTTLIARYCSRSVRGDGRLPAELNDWIRREQRRLNGVDEASHPRRPLVFHQDSTYLTVRLLSAATQYLLILEEHPVLRPSLHDCTVTPREAEVLSWLAQGKTNDEIGMILGISSRTVAKHLEALYPKLGVENRTAAVAQALGTISDRAPHTQGS